MQRLKAKAKKKEKEKKKKTFQGFQNTVCAFLNANESSRLAVYNICFLSLLIKPWLSIKVFLEGCLTIGVHSEVAVHKMYQPQLKG